MGTRELIKNVMQEKLQQKSKEELIDIISDLSSVYIAVRVFGEAASSINLSNESLVRTDLLDIVNATATSLANREPSGQFVCRVDNVLFKKEK